MSINPPTIAAANTSACTWVTNAAKSASDAVVAGATKIANLVSAAFRALSHYASVAFGYAKEGAISGMEAMQANPQVALLVGLAVVVLAASAAYAYKQRTATV